MHATAGLLVLCASPRYLRLLWLLVVLFTSALVEVIHIPPWPCFTSLFTHIRQYLVLPIVIPCLTCLRQRTKVVPHSNPGAKTFLSQFCSSGFVVKRSCPPMQFEQEILRTRIMSPRPRRLHRMQLSFLLYSSLLSSCMLLFFLDLCMFVFVAAFNHVLSPLFPVEPFFFSAYSLLYHFAPCHVIDSGGAHYSTSCSTLHTRNPISGVRSAAECFARQRSYRPHDPAPRAMKTANWGVKAEQIGIPRKIGSQSSQ